jgi:hypothetical protein
MNKPPLPKEHGSWAMFTIPLLLGLMIAPAWHGRVVVSLIAVTGFFLVRYPLAVLVKTHKRASVGKAALQQWAAIYGGLSVLSGAWLVLG